ncbi:MAG: hypothetical protein AAFU65_12275 [Pseudomonadota bacterium]
MRPVIASAPALLAVASVAFITGCGESTPSAEPDEAVVDAVTTETVAATAPVPEPAAPAPVLSAQDQFFASLSELCDTSYTGYLTVGTEPSDRDIGEAALSMHVRDCSKDAIDIAFHVGDDHSRTWQLRRDDGGLSLHHDHRDPDGTPHDPTGYGGRTRDDGTPRRQAFAVDDATVAALPAARGNVWALEIQSGQVLAYDLARPADDRYFRVEFDLSTPTNLP